MTLRDAVMEEVIKKTLPHELLDKDTKYYINPTGRFVIGGPQGGQRPYGQEDNSRLLRRLFPPRRGAFSGKDPTKVDRSGAYMARYAAKNIVASGLADKCEVELAYAIGVARPLSVFVETFGTGKADPMEISKAVREIFDLRPAAIIEHLNLRRPIYRADGAYGHFGRDDLDLPWERLDKAEELKKRFNI